MRLSGSGADFVECSEFGVELLIQSCVSLNPGWRPLRISRLSRVVADLRVERDKLLSRIGQPVGMWGQRRVGDRCCIPLHVVGPVLVIVKAGLGSFFGPER